MPRRYVDFPESFALWNYVSSIGYAITLVGMAFFFAMLIEMFRRSRELSAGRLDGPAGEVIFDLSVGYDLAGTHVAAVVWSTAPATSATALDAAVAALAEAAGGGRPLVVVPSEGTRWLWIHAREAPTAARLRAHREALRDVYRVRSFGDARRLLDRWLARVCRSRIPSFVKLSRTIRAHREGILTAVELGLRTRSSRGSTPRSG